MKLEITKLVGPHCITQDDGQIVFDKLSPPLHKGEPVQLDFTGTKAFASPFFNFAIGQLMRDLTPEKLNELVTVRGLVPDGMIVWRRVVRNARKYYTDSNRKKAVDDAMNRLSEQQ